MNEPKSYYPDAEWYARYVDARVSDDFDRARLAMRRSFSLTKGSAAPSAHPNTTPVRCTLGNEADS